MPLADESPTKKLAANFDRAQVIYIDGIRHAYEIATLAYTRLRATLTVIAGMEKDFEPLSTAAFLDAWAIVDAIDRFRQIWDQAPAAMKAKLADDSPAFDNELRGLRNINDHIATRVSRLVSQKSAAMGVITWFTAIKAGPPEGLLCAIVPGTLRDAALHIPTLNGRRMEWPTGAIRLEAGGHSACLCDAFPILDQRIAALEECLGEFNSKLPDGTEWAGADMLLKIHAAFDGEISAAPPQA